MRQKQWLYGILISVIAMSGCKKDPLKHLTNEETRVYITNYDSSANFQSYKTFSVSDSASVIQNNQSLGQQLGTYESNLIDAIKSSMQLRGYSLVDKSSNPDLAINISEIINTQTNIIDYSMYWDSYGSYYDPYYWGDPGFGYYSPYSMGIYTSQTNGMEIDLLDLKNASTNGNKIVSLWSGLAMGELLFDPSNASSEVQNLFKQSTYIKAN
jgi:hypothetical protein